MNVLLLLLLISLVIAGGFLLAFFWSVRDGQFDDDYSPARRILFEGKTGSGKTKKQDN
jgi:cbb3-type cytochrome oxidase maturation protein